MTDYEILETIQFIVLLLCILALLCMSVNLFLPFLLLLLLSLLLLETLTRTVLKRTLPVLARRLLHTDLEMICLLPRQNHQSGDFLEEWSAVIFAHTCIFLSKMI